ncbi:leucine-rich repeat flightless-interacting protein 2 isoform X4 [Cyclopterus lumpus]|uniref:leucine-rich repeat flightless-interacting protein 2 isoform X4 n=1 Tax=Cyclopterus lumpus TaxID=8103 RepID=UPI001485ED8A|nr:leucine-rich repeat flightless-interacting protein 2 isoform X4 [Cyclopterus lumpus]XP_034406812.1 leucine-rich repeat flightless-interacting protein 2 isoform X4 [Cyclopterus lumpus]
MEDSAPGKTTMGTQGPGRKRIPNQEKRTAEDDSLNQVAREAEARLAARRAARAEAREIRMKELERQHKELFHSHKEDSERYARHSRRHTSMSDDEERMSVGSRSSLRPSDYSGFLGSSSRASSRASSARASPVVEERPDRDFMDKVSRTASTLSAATLASLGGASSRRGSCDTSFSVETEASIRDMKDSLAQAEDRYRKAMVSNAQLHNEKSSLMFQVENLKEELGDMEELLWENRRHWDDRTKEVERERQARLLLQLRLTEMEEALRRSEEMLTEVSDLRLKSSSYCQEVSDLQEVLQWKEKKMAALEKQREISDIVRIERDRLRNDVVRLRDLLKKHGVIFSPEFSTNGETGPGEDDDVSAESDPRLAESTLELRLKKLFEERESLRDQVRLLKSQLDQRQKTGTERDQNPEGGGLENGVDSHLLDLQRDANRQISDFKFKLVKSEQEVTTLEQNVIRLEGQVTRYKSASENAEKIEDELKVDKRKLHRELRSALDRIGELELLHLYEAWHYLSSA